MPDSTPGAPTAAGRAARPQRGRGLHLRIAALISGVACVLAGGLGVLVAATSAHQRLDLNRAIVLGRLEAALRNYAATSTVIGDNVAFDAPDLPADLSRGVAGQRMATRLTEGLRGPVLWAAAGIGTHTLSVRTDYGLERKADERFNRSVGILALGSAAAISAAGLLLATPLSARLRRVSRTAREIADGRLDARIGQVKGAREITELAASVDQMANALRERLRAEQRFAADVAHELRTPAAGLLAAAEILPESHETDLVRGRAGALCDLIEEVLEVSRLDAQVDAPELEPHHPAEQLHRVVASTGLPATVDVLHHSVVLTDPRRLGRIVANLLVNAHRHGTAPVTLTLDRGTITVRDSGPGYPADLLAEGPRPFRTGTPERGKGSGLGLTIAAGHARLIAATLTFTNPPGGGAQATLVLPLDPEAT